MGCPERILFIASGHSDYLEDLSFVGLSGISGKENVVPLRAMRKHYISTRVYPKNMSRTRGAVDYVRDKFAVRKIMKQSAYDCVIIGSAKRDVFEKYNKIAAKISRNAKVIFIDGGDEAEVGADAVRLGFEALYKEAFSKKAPDVIFKREYLKNKDYPANVYPLPLAYGGPALDGAGGGKKYDVVFWAVDNMPVRAKVLDFCAGKWDCDENGSSRGQTFKKYNRKGIRYLAELAASKVCYNFRGGGWDTLRYWEIPAVGSLMISGKPGIVIPDDFEHGKHAVFCKDDLSDLEELTNYYLKHDREREEIAAEGKKHLLKYHTARNRAEYILDIIEKKC